jgi:hypothetical protein
MTKEFTDIDIQKLIENNDSLSKSSKISYTCAIKRLIAIIKYDTANLPLLKKEKNIIINITNEKNIYTVLTTPNIYVKKIKDCTENNRTFTSTIGFILTIIKYLKLNDSKNKKIIAYVNEWQKNYKTEIDNVNNSKNSNLENENTISIEWQDIINKQKELEKKSLGKNDTFLVSLYSLIAPRKIKDFYLMKINPEKPEEEQNNFINLKGKKSFICIKTNKSKDDFIKELPKELDEIIKQNLLMYPREYLFVSKKGIPFENGIKGVNSFTKQINRDFNNIFGDNITVNTIRNSYINYHLSLYKLNKITLKELKEISADMVHDISQQLLFEKKNKI